MQTNDLEEFRNRLIQEVRVRAEAEKDFERTAFTGHCVKMLQEAEVLGDVEPAFYEGRGARGRALAVDGYCIDEVDDSVALLLADFEPTGTPRSLTMTQVQQLLGRVQAFLEEALGLNLRDRVEESAPIQDLLNHLQSQRSDISRFRIFLLSDGFLSTRVSAIPETAVRGVPVESHVWDLSRFHRVISSATGRDDLEVDFTQYTPSGIPCIQAAAGSGRYPAYLCVVPGGVLARIYEAYGSRLLEGNVRAFLSVRGKVNKGIRRTILQEPDMFFAYNNGIAATATDLRVEKTAEGLHLLEARDFQIVNGGQTTASLTNALKREKADLNQVFVQMKLSRIPPEESGEVIPEISRYANSQNKVSDADFFSNHPFHRRMEDISRRLLAPPVAGSQIETHWFYERARGQYENEAAGRTPAEKRRFELAFPKRQVITKTDLAKYEFSWRMLPHKVSFGAQKNFMFFAEEITKEWERNPDAFNEEFYREIVAKKILFDRTAVLVSAQPWYQGGYRANIVTHGIARLARLVRDCRKDGEFDLRTIWQQQAVPEAVESQLMEIARQVFEVLTHPDAGIQNVTEWSKKEACWTRVADTTPPVLKAFLDLITDRSEVKQRKKAAARTQRVDDGISAQAEVVKRPASYWKRLLDWGLAHRVVAADEAAGLKIAAQLPNKIPNEVYCRKILQALARAEEEGFESA